MGWLISGGLILENGFSTVFEHTMIREGLLSDLPEDRGGYTFMGISRRRHPGWEGWPAVDDLARGLGGIRKDNIPSFLYDMVKAFYYTNFWLEADCHRVRVFSKTVSEKLFDTAVNVGPTRAAMFMQRALNLLNLNEQIYNDITVDGHVGVLTLRALNSSINTSGDPSLNERKILNVMRILQGCYYVELMEKDSKREIFRGWFDRALV